MGYQFINLSKTLAICHTVKFHRGTGELMASARSTAGAASDLQTSD